MLDGWGDGGEGAWRGTFRRSGLWNQLVHLGQGEGALALPWSPDDIPEHTPHEL